MNGLRLLKSNFCDISSTLHRLSVRNVGIGPRNSCATVHNSNPVTQNGKISRKSANYITGKSLGSFSRTFRPIEAAGRRNVSRCLCTAHDGFCLSFEEFRSLVESKDIQIIDVREPDEIEQEGSIPNAVNIPLNELSSALSLPPDKFQALYSLDIGEPEDNKLVFSCRSGIRSGIALTIALELGFINSRHYGGGYSEWSERMKSQVE